MVALTPEQVLNTWEEFFGSKKIKSERNLVNELFKSANSFPDVKSFIIDYWDLDFFDSKFADMLLNFPQYMIYSGEQAILNLLPADVIENGVKLTLRIINLPNETCEIDISKLRAEHIGKFISIKGIIRKALVVRPLLDVAVFQCLRCYTIIKVKQEGLEYKEPLECAKEQGGCGRAASGTAFKLLTDPKRDTSKFIDFQKVEIQERPELLAMGREPEKLEAHIDKDLSGDILPGDRVIFNGVLISVQKLNKFKSKTNLFDIYLEVNSIETEEKTFEDIKLDDDDIKLIIETSKDPTISEKITSSIAPSLYGLEIIKEAIALQLFSGVRKDGLPDGTIIRGDGHILLVGDPGVGKSQLLLYATKLSPRGIYASGKSTSSAGLTAACVRDDFSEGQFTLEAGALVLANKGLAACDEIDKMNSNDRSAFHEAMEQQQITIHKAGLSATLPSQCSVLAAGNPKYGRFDEYQPIAGQIDLSPPLLSRFDAIFKMIDKPDKDKDEQLAAHMLNTHYAGQIEKNIRISQKTKFKDEDKEKAMESITPPFTIQFLRKYIAYAKLYISPVFDAESMKLLKEYFVNLRVQSGNPNGESTTVAATPRQLESAIRWAEASARMELRETVKKKDVERAVKITMQFLMDVASDQGILDIDILTTGMGHAQRERIITVMDIIYELSGMNKKGTARKDEVMDRAESRNLNREQTEKDLEKLRREGRIFYPADNIIKLS